MNYLPFAGYWFYGAASATARAAGYCSWGLIGSAPTDAGGAPTAVLYGGLYGPFRGPI